ncbi:MAG: tyrosine-type recombinase/integrase [Candidatus Delongbacteria bacterium]
MPLTDAALKAMKPKPKPYTVSDGRGLYVEVFPTGGVVWRFRYRLDGRLEKLTLGKYPELSLKLARAWRDEAAHKVLLGESPARQKQLAKVAADETATVAEFTERFLREVLAKDIKNVRVPRRYFDKDILPFIGERPMSTISTEDVRAIVWRAKDKGIDATAGKLRGMLFRLCDFAITCGVMQANPVTALPMRHVFKKKSRERALSRDEIRTFLNAIGESTMRRQLQIALRLLLLTMTRKSELMLANWANVDLAAAEWHIPAEQSKTGKPHIVYLSRQALELFQELRGLADSSELVLPGCGSLNKPFAPTTLNMALERALHGYGMAGFTIHDLRRTSSTLLHENGWPSDVVEKALNHTIGGMRGVYNRAEYADQRREMLQFWADFVEKA